MKPNHWTIYCHIHIELGRRYVGLTKKTMMHRWNQHYAQAKNSVNGRWHFSNAIRKYGKDAFSHEVLEICNSLEEANLAEEKWIEHFQTRNPKLGFNLAKGGDHVPHLIKKNPWDNQEYRERNLPQFIAAGQSSVARAAQKASLNTPESKAKRSALAKSSMNSPETIEKRRKMREDPNYSKKISEATKAALAKPEIKIRVSDGVKKSWQNPEIRARMESGVRKALSNPEIKIKSSNNIKKSWQNPEIRARRIEAFKKDASRPEKKEKLSRAALGRHHSPENIEKMKISARQRFAFCKFCNASIGLEGHTCINGRVSCRDCRELYDRKLASFLRPDGSFVLN